jgi:periodic tryptophan protein 2
VISSSLDGTVRAYDLVRYQNFRTLTTPTPVQLTSLAVDSSGEMVCAGAMDPFQIYVWSLQSGKLLDVLSGHEGPLACLTFAHNNGRLASGSWDGTLKIWDIYKNECIETFEHGCDVMAIAFRPDGKEICTATTNGLITFWDVDSGSQLGTIEGRKDISVGRKSTDFITSKSLLKTKYFTCLAYTADGSCILAGSQSKSVCIYSVASGTLIKKFELSHNR